MRIALVSLDQEWLDKDSNFVKCQDSVKKAVDTGCDLVIFPEMTLTGFSPETESIVESSPNSETLERFGKLSKKNGINIIFGVCLMENSSEKPFNMLCLADATGYVKPLYAKIHLFSYVNEDDYLSPGSKIVTEKIGDTNFGFAICYDLRFPELFSIMSSACRAIVVIANWPEAREDHWHTLLKARAIENEVIIFGVNRVGVDGNGIGYKQGSVMILPDGSIQKPVETFSFLNIYNMDGEQVERYRKTFPTIKDKMFSLYKRYL